LYQKYQGQPCDVWYTTLETRQLARIRTQAAAKASTGKSQGCGSRSLSVRLGGALAAVSQVALELPGVSLVRSPGEAVLVTTHCKRHKRMPVVFQKNSDLCRFVIS
jgi:hypothetical protein